MPWICWSRSGGCSHVPSKGEQMVHYNEYYSNVSRGKRNQENQDEWIPWLLEPDESAGLE
jgi:hypothetical protein